MLMGGGISITIISPRINIKDVNRSSFAPANRKGSNGRSQRRAVVWLSFGPVSPAQPERHYGCFMFACRIPLKRLMPGSLSQPRTRYPPAACSDLVNEFISSVATAGSAPPHSDSQPVSFCRVGVDCEQVVSCGSSKTSLQYDDSNFASWLESVRVHVRSVFFLLVDAIKLFPKCQLFRNYAKQALKGIREPKSHLSHRRRKLFSTRQQRYSIHFSPSLSLWIYLFVCPLSLLFLWASRCKWYYQKNPNARSRNRAKLIMNLIIPGPKWRSLLQSSLGRG